MSQKHTPFGLLFAGIDMRTQGYTPPPSNVNYDPLLQRSMFQNYSLGDTGTWGTSTTFYDKNGYPNGTDDDAMRDDH